MRNTDLNTDLNSDLNSDLSDLILKRTYTASGTIPANGINTVRGTISAISGYTIISKQVSSSTWGAQMTASVQTLSDSAFEVVFRSWIGADMNVDVSCQVTYIKSEFVGI